MGGKTQGIRHQPLTDSAGEAVAQATTAQDTTGVLKNNFNQQEIEAEFHITQAFVQQVGTFLDNRAKEAERAKADLEQAKHQGADQATLDKLQAQVDAADKWAPGGSYRQILTALTAAAGGDVTGGASRFAQAAAATGQSCGAAAQGAAASVVLNDLIESMTVKIEVGYPAGGGVRPSNFLVTATIDGKVKKFPFSQ